MNTEEWKGRQDLKKPLHKAKEFTYYLIWEMEAKVNLGNLRLCLKIKKVKIKELFVDTVHVCMNVCMYVYSSVVVREQEEEDEDEQGTFCLHINGQLFLKFQG